MALTQEAAREIIRAGLAEGRAKGFRPMAVAVLDAGGHPIAFEREDGAPPGRFELARAKAYGALMLGVPGSALVALAEKRPTFTEALPGIYGGRFVAGLGGVLVRNAAGAVIGAVGVSGDAPENDALLALAGIAAAGFAGEA